MNRYNYIINTLTFVINEITSKNIKINVPTPGYINVRAVSCVDHNKYRFHTSDIFPRITSDLCDEFSSHITECLEFINFYNVKSLEYNSMDGWFTLILIDAIN